MKREQRLQSAKDWLKTYPAENIVKGYRQHFGVDWPTAFRELEIIGIEIDPVYKKRVLETVENLIAARRRKQEEQISTSEDLLSDFRDDTFAFIAGYTSGGAPYGITWEEWDKLEGNEKDE